MIVIIPRIEKLLWLICLLVLVATFGCKPAFQPPPGALACRLLANRADHAKIVATANEQQGQQVMQDGRVVARWYPVASNSDAANEILNGESTVTRKRPNGIDVLVMHGATDLSENHIEAVRLGNFDAMGIPAVTIYVTQPGESLLGQLTENNLPRDDGTPRSLALIVDGHVYSIPRIQAKVSSMFSISTTGQKQAEEIAELLGAMP